MNYEDLDIDLSQFEDWPRFVPPVFIEPEVDMEVCNELHTPQAKRQCKDYILTSGTE